MGEIAIRFVVGGLIVSTFAIVGDLCMPKSFAGLFAAAPSVALASLLISLSGKGASFAAVEAYGMIGGAIALFIYANCVRFAQMRTSIPSYATSLLFVVLWLAAAAGWLLAQT